MLDDVVLAPWNDLEALESILRRHRRDLAAVITEPIMANMGCILPRDGYSRKFAIWLISTAHFSSSTKS